MDHHGSVLYRVLNKGSWLFGNKMTLANAIGMVKAKAYVEKTFKPGQDLIDEVPELKKARS